MKKYAISDIHGCAQTFENLLDRIGFSTQDELYLLGDYVDRGPDSRGVIDIILRLWHEGYNVHCLRGNHEEMLLHEINDEGIWERNDETMASFSCRYAKDISDVYKDFLENLHWYLEVDDYFLVHAGLNFNLPDPLSDKDDMTWIRNWYTDIDRDWLGDRIIVHGHTPCHRSAIYHSLKHFDQVPAIGIDNGCVFQTIGMGHLCAFDLTNRKVVFEMCVG